MILKQSNSYLSSNVFRDVYVFYCKNKIVEMIKNQELGMQQILQMYSIDDINNSLDSIRLNQEGDLYIPEQEDSSVVLRYLEYGGENVRALHLFTKVNKHIL